MVRSACIGFCRSSNNKKLSEYINGYLAGKIDERELKTYCQKVRLENIEVQKNIGIDIIPCNDFSMYDHMLDATCLVGNIQRRYYWEGGIIPLEIYFLLANGMQKDKFDVVPLKLQNWLNTNYLYHVPEFVQPIDFTYSDNKPIVEYLEAKRAGVETRPTIIAPITYLLQGKLLDNDTELLSLVDEILPVYKELFVNCQRIGIKSIQLEDPMICSAIDFSTKEKYKDCYEELRGYAGDIELHLVSYYGSLYDNFDFVRSLPVNSIHIDIPYNKEYLNEYVDRIDKSVKISLGIVDARNVWKNNLNESIEIVSKFCDKIGSENVVVANSSPLFLCPYSVELEQDLPSCLENSLSFAVEKLRELEIIKKAINDGKKSVESELNLNKKLFNKKTCNYYFGDVSCYSDDVKDVKGNKTEKYNSRWHDFIEKNKIRKNPMMFSGNADVEEIQKHPGVDIVSVGFTEKSYDISDYRDYTKGIHVLNGNLIPRFGCEYYYPTIIYDDISIKKDIFEDCIKDAKKYTKKPLKFNVCSPVHFINFAFVSPFVDVKDIYRELSLGLVKSLQYVMKDIDILQINEFTFTTGVKINCLKSVDRIDCICDNLNHFIDLIGNSKCVALYNSYEDLNDVFEYICDTKVDIIFTSSVRSGHDILNIFVKYKPKIPIGFGMIDLYSSRVTTKSDVSTVVSRMFNCIDSDNVAFVVDGDFTNKKNIEDHVLKSLTNFDSSFKVVLKEIEKEKKHDAKEVKIEEKKKKKDKNVKKKHYKK